MWGWIIALISGALMSVQGVFNTGLTKQTSLWVANSWVQGTALAVCLGAGGFKVHASWRCDRGVYYIDGDSEYGPAWAGEGCVDHCCFPVGSGLSD